MHIITRWVRGFTERAPQELGKNDNSGLGVVHRKARLSPPRTLEANATNRETREPFFPNLSRAQISPSPAGTLRHRRVSQCHICQLDCDQNQNSRGSKFPMTAARPGARWRDGKNQRPSWKRKTLLGPFLDASVPRSPRLVGSRWSGLENLRDMIDSLFLQRLPVTIRIPSVQRSEKAQR